VSSQTVSVQYHYNNPTKHVGLVQREHNFIRCNFFSQENFSFGLKQQSLTHLLISTKAANINFIVFGQSLDVNIHNLVLP
jgi:hypothetical protein